MLIVVYDYKNNGLDFRRTLNTFIKKKKWNIEFSKMAFANLHIYDDNYKLQICKLYSVTMKTQD